VGSEFERNIYGLETTLPHPSGLVSTVYFRHLLNITLRCCLCEHCLRFLFVIEAALITGLENVIII
jgi:hypothetical protein